MERAQLHDILSTLFHRLTDIEIEGVENVPAQGAFILTTNHISRLDVPLLMITTPRNDMVALVADKYKPNPLFSFIVHTTHSIWIDRSRADIDAFRGAKEHIKKGGVLGIAPEGTRSNTHALLEGKQGSAYLAEMMRVPIVPVGITGTEHAMAQILTFRRPKIHVRYGELYTLPPLDRADRNTSLQRNTDEIMCRIAALLPESYRGYYKDYPRVKELEKSLTTEGTSQ
ncbi:MAG TPA: lysophospholipid acyltransferase family protein [Anaerolineaceae bacterium]|nr:lysophospholipid acyltransferase family protein [Anaerolineaceae bacterium]